MIACGYIFDKGFDDKKQSIKEEGKKNGMKNTKK